MDTNKLIEFEVKGKRLQACIDELGIIHSTAKMLTSYYSYLFSFYNDIYYDIPHTDLQNLEPYSKVVRPLTKFIFESYSSLDSMQIQALMNPKPGHSASPSFMERRSTLQMWMAWSKRLGRVTFINPLKTLNRIKHV